MTPRLCPATKLPIYTRLVAQLESEGARRNATGPQDPRHEASFRECATCNGWHVHIPRKRKNAPTETSPDQ